MCIYLYKKCYDEDSIPFSQSIFQSVEQSAVPVNQVKLQTDRWNTALIKNPLLSAGGSNSNDKAANQ